MKDLFFIVVFIVALLLAAWALQSAEGQTAGPPGEANIDFFQLPLTGKTALAYRLTDARGETVATHVIAIESIAAMSWVEVNDITRSSFSFAGSRLEHTLEFDEFMEAYRLATANKMNGTMPTLIQLYEQWETEEQ